MYLGKGKGLRVTRAPETKRKKGGRVRERSKRGGIFAARNSFPYEGNAQAVGSAIGRSTTRILALAFWEH